MAKEKKETPPEAAEAVGAKISFHAAVLNHDGAYFTQEFATLDELVAYIKTRIDQDVSVFAFRGERLRVSKGPLRYLLVPGSDPIALYETPEELEPDDTGYLGVDPINLSDPPQLRVPAAGRPTTAQQDEFFDSDSGNILGAFDDALPDPDS